MSDNRDRQKNRRTEEIPSPYALLSSHRTELMGLATLWVMYNHAMLLGLTAQREPFRFIQLFAHISVDIFFLLSGFGIYHSLQRNSVRVYFLKRLARLLPVWGSFLLIHLITDRLVFGLTFSLKEIVGFLTFQGFRAGLGNQGNWYVYTIFLYYLIAPIPFSFLKESKHKLTACALLAAVCHIASYSYFGNRDLLITFIRLPAFIIGMYLACGADLSSGAQTDTITKSLTAPFTKAGMLVCALIVLCFGSCHFIILKKCSVDVLWDYGLWWHALIPMAAPFSLLACLLFSLAKSKKNPLTFCLRLIGGASLEIFLIHLYIFKYWGEITGILLRQSVPVRIGVFFLSILLGLAWHGLITAAKRLPKRLSRNP